MGPRLGIPRDRIDVIPRGRDLKRLGFATEARRLRVRGQLRLGAGPVVLCAARQEYQKGLDVLLEAVSRLEAQDWTLLLAGRPGNETATLLERLTSPDLADRVRLLGMRSDIPDLLSACDVFVLPSRWEGLGSVLLEAMALKTPIVASDVPAIREVTGGTAKLVSPGEVTQLQVSLDFMLSDRAAAEQLAGAAFERFLRHYTIDRIADRTVEFYAKALE
jgi:glycosyltransferase involved in cell wall biosynthesis